MKVAFAPHVNLTW